MSEQVSFHPFLVKFANLTASLQEVDLSQLTEEEKQMYEKYGRLPKKTDILKKRNERLRVSLILLMKRILHLTVENHNLHKLKGGNHQKFDSADWALKKSQEQSNQNKDS